MAAGGRSCPLEVFAAHSLVAAVPEQALVAPLRSLLARVEELALRFPIGGVIAASVARSCGRDELEVEAYVSNLRRLSSFQGAELSSDLAAAVATEAGSGALEAMGSFGSWEDMMESVAGCGGAGFSGRCGWWRMKS